MLQMEQINDLNDNILGLALTYAYVIDRYWIAIAKGRLDVKAAPICLANPSTASFAILSARL